MKEDNPISLSFEEMSQYPIARRFGNMVALGRDEKGYPRFLLGPHCNNSPMQTRSSSLPSSSAPSSSGCSSTATTPGFPPSGRSSSRSHAAPSCSAISGSASPAPESPTRRTQPPPSSERTAASAISASWCGIGGLSTVSSAECALPSWTTTVPGWASAWAGTT